MSENLSEKEQEISNERNIETQTEVVTGTELKQVVEEVIQSEFSGPIPPPSIINGYEEVVPGSADRIIRMAEKQSEHRQHMEEIMIKTEARDSLLGILFAFILGIGCIVASIVIVIAVPENAGAISGALIGMTGIGSIIVTFIKSTRGHYDKRSDNDDSKNK